MSTQRDLTWDGTMPATVRRLTDRHREILFLVSKGLRNAEIAHQLGLTERTIKGRVSQFLLIFDVTNRTELAGLVTADSYDAEPYWASRWAGA